jgi:hypothetical protein
MLNEDRIQELVIGGGGWGRIFLDNIFTITPLPPHRTFSLSPPPPSNQGRSYGVFVSTQTLLRNKFEICNPHCYGAKRPKPLQLGVGGGGCAVSPRRKKCILMSLRSIKADGVYLGGN